MNVTKDRRKIIELLGKLRGNKFENYLIDAFISAQNEVKFWIDIQDYFIYQALNSLIPKFTINKNFKEIREITKIISKIVPELKFIDSIGFDQKLAKYLQKSLELRIKGFQSEP